MELATPPVARPDDRVRRKAMTRGTRFRAVEPAASGGEAKIRVLVVFEREYRSYREAIAFALRGLRPRAEVAVADLDALEAELERTSPDLVICSQPNAGRGRNTLVWVELPSDPEQPAAVCLEGRCSRTPCLTLDDLLSIFDGTEVLSGRGSS